MDNFGKHIDLAYMRNQLEKYTVDDLFRLAMEQNIWIGETDNNEWKSVKDVLPKEFEPVLVYHLGDYPKGYNNMATAYWQNLGIDGEEIEVDWCDADGFLGGSHAPTHWKYLPEPPILNTTNNA